MNDKYQTIRSIGLIEQITMADFSIILLRIMFFLMLEITIIAKLYEQGPQNVKYNR